MSIASRSGSATPAGWRGLYPDGGDVPGNGARFDDRRGPGGSELAAARIRRSPSFLSQENERAERCQPQPARPPERVPPPATNEAGCAFKATPLHHAPSMEQTAQEQERKSDTGSLQAWSQERGHTGAEQRGPAGGGEVRAVRALGGRGDVRLLVHGNSSVTPPGWQAGWRRRLPARVDRVMAGVSNDPRVRMPAAHDVSSRSEFAPGAADAPNAPRNTP